MQPPANDKNKFASLNSRLILCVCTVCAGSGVEKPIGEVVLQVDMMQGKERKVNVRGETSNDANKPQRK